MRIKKHFLKRFQADTSGSMITLVALTLPVLIGVGALAIDIGYAYSVKSSAQQAADFSGLAALTEIRDDEQAIYHAVSNVSSNYASKAVAHASANMPKIAKDKAVAASDVTFGFWDFSARTFDGSPGAFPVNAVRVNAEFSAARGNAVPTFMSKIFKRNVDVSVSSLALLPLPPSFHILSPDQSAAFDMSASDIDALTVLVNSDAPDAMHFQGHSGNIGSASFKVAGEISGSPGSKVESGAEPWSDFLSEMPSPIDDGTCDYTNYETTSLVPIIRSGTYCGGLKISGALMVFFDPNGTFIIKDGPLEIDASMRNRPISGENVLIYLTGKDSGLKVHGGDITLRAAKTGPWAGIAIFAARGAEAPQVNTVEYAQLFFEGIFYAPESPTSFYRSSLNGTCNYLCFAAQSIRLDRTFINYGPFMAGRSTALGTAQRPARPPALARKIAPYVVPEPF